MAVKREQSKRPVRNAHRPFLFVRHQAAKRKTPSPLKQAWRFADEARTSNHYTGNQGALPTSECPPDEVARQLKQHPEIARDDSTTRDNARRG
jgi:hypothetical protein